MELTLNTKKLNKSCLNGLLSLLVISQTKIRFGKTWVKNCLENLDEMRAASSAECLEIYFRDKMLLLFHRDLR